MTVRVSSRVIVTVHAGGWGILVSKNEKRFPIRETDWLSRSLLVKSYCTLGFYIGKIRVGGAGRGAHL